MSKILVCLVVFTHPYSIQLFLPQMLALNHTYSIQQGRRKALKSGTVGRLGVIPPAGIQRAEPLLGVRPPWKNA